MLEHEPQQMPAVPTSTAQIPAAERRVSAEELARAVSALEDAKAAERIAGVAPIGQVVDELGLDATPEEIWAQVQKQRAQKADDKQARQAPSAAVFQTPPRPRRRRRWWVAVGIVLVIWGAGHSTTVQTTAPVTSVSGATVTANGPTITISGEDQTETIPVRGKDVVITGEDNNITLTGQARSVTISGEDNKVQGDAPKAFVSEGEDNTANWNSNP